MIPSILIPIPIPNGAAEEQVATVIHHRDTETQSHRRGSPQITRMNTDEPSHFLLIGRMGAGRAFKNDAPYQEMISVFLCAPLCLCGETPPNAPEIGAHQ